MTRPPAIRCKITMSNGDVWYATCPPLPRKTPEEAVAYLNRVSKKGGVGATYELATEEAYWKYRSETRVRSLEADIPVQWKPTA